MSGRFNRNFRRFDGVEREIAEALPLDATASQVWLMSGDGSWKVDARFALHGDLTV